MKALYFFIAAGLLALASCDDAEKPKEQSGDLIQSFELGGSNFRDTINLVDGSGYKQGLWIMRISKDTMIYQNDTGYSTKGKTSGEVIRFLKTNKDLSLFFTYDSLAVKSH